MDTRPAKPSDVPEISSLITRLTHFFTLDPAGVGTEGFLSSLEPSPISKLVTAPNFNRSLMIALQRLIMVSTNGARAEAEDSL